MHVLKAGVLYFAIVFAAGFLLGPLRIVLVVPAAWRESGRTLGIACHDRGHNLWQRGAWFADWLCRPH